MAGSSRESKKRGARRASSGLGAPTGRGIMQGGEKDRAQGYQGTRAAAASSRHRGRRRDGKGGGEDGTSTRPPPAWGRGAAPALPLPRTIQVGPGRARLGPRTPPGPPAPSRVPPAPTASGGEGVGARPTRPSNLLQVHSHASRPFDSQLRSREGPCPPRPLPPGYIRSQRSQPPPARACSEGPEEFLGSAGSATPAMCPTSRARRTAGRVAARRTHSLSPLQPAPPSTHLSPGPTESGRGSLGPGFPAFRSPFGPRSLSPISEGQSVRRLSPAAPATCPKFRCPARELRLPPPPGLLRLHATGKARPARPFTLPSAPPPLPMSSPRPPPPLSPSPAPGARAPTVNPHPLPAAPGRGQHTPPRGPAPPCSAPRGPTAAPAGKCSPSRRFCQARRDL